MEYTMVAEQDLPTFKDKVRQKLEDGWELHGPLIVVPLLLEWPNEHLKNNGVIWAREFIKLNTSPRTVMRKAVK